MYNWVFFVLFKIMFRYFEEDFSTSICMKTKNGALLRIVSPLADETPNRFVQSSSHTFR